MACIPAHCAGVKRAHEACPEVANEILGRKIGVRVRARANEGAGQPYEECDDENKEKREEAKPGHQGGCASRHGVVEGVAQALAEGDVPHVSPLLLSINE